MPFSAARRVAQYVVVGSTLLALACGGSPPEAPSPATRPQGVFYLSYAPDPAVASASFEPGSDWVTRFTVRIRESGGVAIEVSLIEVGISTDVGARVILGPEEIATRAGGTRLEPRARLDVPVEITYRGESSETDLQVVVSGTDALGQPVEIRGGMPVR